MQRLIITAAGCLSLASGAMGSVVNGDFGTGDLSGWESLGMARVVDGAAYGSSDASYGQFQALLENGRLAFVGTPQETETTDVTAAEIEAFAGLTPGTLDGLSTGVATEGSAIRQQINVTAGQVLRVRFKFLTDEDFFNDYAFVSIVPQHGATLLSQVFEPDGSEFPPFNPELMASSTRYLSETGYLEFEQVLTESGVITLTLGVVDVDDFLGDDISVDSGLLVSYVLVPEPTSVALVTMGSLLLLKRRSAGARG